MHKTEKRISKKNAIILLSGFALFDVAIFCAFYSWYQSEPAKIASSHVEDSTPLKGRIETIEPVNYSLNVEANVGQTITRNDIIESQKIAEPEIKVAHENKIANLNAVEEKRPQISNIVQPIATSAKAVRVQAPVRVENNQNMPNPQRGIVASASITKPAEVKEEQVEEVVVRAPVIRTANQNVEGLTRGNSLTISLPRRQLASN